MHRLKISSKGLCHITITLVSIVLFQLSVAAQITEFNGQLRLKKNFPAGEVNLGLQTEFTVTYFEFDSDVAARYRAPQHSFSSSNNQILSMNSGSIYLFEELNIGNESQIRFQDQFTNYHADIRWNGNDLLITNSKDNDTNNRIEMTSTDGFIFRSGPSSTSRIKIGRDGNMAIGPEIGDADFTLDINHGEGSPSSDANHGLNIANSGGNNNQWQLYVRNGGGGDLELFKNRNLRGHFDATSGNYSTSSDRRLKRNIRTLKNQLGLVMQLRPTIYQFKNQESNREIYGLIAQEVAEILPDIVRTMEEDKDGNLYGLSYIEFIPVIIAAMQEQQEMIRSQNDQNAKLIDRIDKLERLIEGK